MIQLFEPGGKIQESFVQGLDGSELLVERVNPNKQNIIMATTFLCSFYI